MNVVPGGQAEAKSRSGQKGFQQLNCSVTNQTYYLGTQQANSVLLLGIPMVL